MISSLSKALLLINLIKDTVVLDRHDNPPSFFFAVVALQPYIPRTTTATTRAILRTTTTTTNHYPRLQQRRPTGAIFTSRRKVAVVNLETKGERGGSRKDAYVTNNAGYAENMDPWSKASKKQKQQRQKQKRQQQKQEGSGRTDGSESSSKWTTSSSSSVGAAASASNRTLYEILGATPTATRSELKQKYIGLARQSHPDALIETSSSSSSASPATEVYEFTEIAEAWKVLGDPKQRKRYDRSLKAEALSASIVNWAGDVSLKAKPAAEFSAKLFEKVAVPFIRRTAATTMASFQAAAADLAQQPSTQAAAAVSTSNNMTIEQVIINSEAQTAEMLQQQRTRRNPAKTIENAMKAAQRAGRAVDKLELLEKAQELEGRALTEYRAAMEIQKDLQLLAEKRLIMSLHTANSGLTSGEALILLEEFNKTVSDQLSVLDRAMRRHSVEDEIAELEVAEESFVDAQVADSDAQEKHRENVRNRLLTRTALLKAEKHEEEMRRLYQEAQRLVVEKRRELDGITKDLAQSETVAKKSRNEVEKLTLAIEKQSERVRNVLRQREKAVMKHRPDMETMKDSTTQEENADRLEQLSEIRQKERSMAESASQMELSAARMLSRANKLKDKANELDENFT